MFKKLLRALVPESLLYTEKETEKRVKILKRTIRDVQAEVRYYKKECREEVERRNKYQLQLRKISAYVFSREWEAINGK